MSLLMNVPDILFGLGLAAVTPVQAQQQPRSFQDDAAALVQVARQQCNPGVPALRTQPRLSEAARRLSRGVPLKTALEDSDYRARRSVQWTFKGYASTDAVAQALVQKHCASLGNPELAEVGVQRNGNSYWLVAAAPFDPPAQGAAGDVASRVLALVNQARTQPRRCGGQSFAAAPLLTLNAVLTRAAATHAESMARLSYMEHQGRDGSTPADRASRAGYDWRSIGENIAMGQTTPEKVMQDWLRSPEHCANIMEPRFTEMGLAFAVNSGSEGGIYWAQAFGLPKRPVR
jgi:uncharacterized protein YkwD